MAIGTLAWSPSMGRFGVQEWAEGDAEPVRHWDVDLIVLQRWMFASVAVETATARRKGQVVVQEVDDHFWALDTRNRAFRATDPRTSPVENRDHYLAAIKAASAVTTSTPYLAGELRRLGVRCPIHVLENHVDLDAFASVREANLERKPSSRPIVGWVGATPWRSGDLETLRGVLGPFLARHGLDAYHGGHSDGWDTLAAQAGLEEEKVIKRSMVPIQEYPSLMEGLEVGLVPLRDSAFNRAKSWIKGIEYAAAGVPFVAQDLPEYRRLYETHGIGRIARRPKDWVRHLEALMDPGLRLDEAQGVAAMVKALDIREGIKDWSDLYLSLLAGG